MMLEHNHNHNEDEEEEQDEVPSTSPLLSHNDHNINPNLNNNHTEPCCNNPNLINSISLQSIRALFVDKGTERNVLFWKRSIFCI